MTVSLDSSDLVPLVSSIALLTSAQQAVFVHCLKHSQHPAYYSGETRRIAVSLRMHVRTVQRSLQVIKRDPILRKIVFPSKERMPV